MTELRDMMLRDTGERCRGQISNVGRVIMGGFTNFNSVDRYEDRPHNAVNAFFQDYAGYWKEVYQTDTLSGAIYRERRSAVLSMVDKLGLPPSSRILEVGCGAGSTSVALAKKGYRVNAVDTVDSMLDLTRQAADEAGLGANLDVSLADIGHLSFPSQHFALAMAVGVFPWVEYPQQGVVELHRVVRSGGYVILTATNKWCLNQILDPLCFPGLRPMRWRIAQVLEEFNIWRRSRPRQHRYSVKQIDTLLSQTGFRKLAGRTLGFGPFTTFKHKLFSNPHGIKLHEKFQALANRNFPVVRSCGVVYVVLAQKA